MSIFSLGEVKVKQTENIENSNFNSWPENGIYSYFAGGYDGNFSDRIIRLDFFIETVTNPGSTLSAAREDLESVSSSSYGYFAGGSPGGSAIDRLDFSTELRSTNPSVKLPSIRYLYAATSSSSYGYLGGGYSPTLINTITRLDFSSETVSAPGNNLTRSLSYLSASENDSYGYYIGGFPSFPPTPGSRSSINRLSFSTETVSEPNNYMSEGLDWHMSLSSENYIYIAGGENPSQNPAARSVIRRMDFSTETIVNTNNNLPDDITGGAASSNLFYGYFSGGQDTYGLTSVITRLDFSNEVVSNPGKTLATYGNGLYGLSSVSAKSLNLKSLLLGRNKGKKTYGYFGGGKSGNAPTIRSTIERLDFSTETRTNLTSNLSQTKSNLAATSNNFYGYFGGGFNPGSTYYSTIDRLDLSNEVLTTLNDVLSVQKEMLAATSSSSYGYFAGGFTPLAPPGGHYSTIDRLDFSTETKTVPSSKLSRSKWDLTSVSSNFYGYFGGGSTDTPTTYLSTIERLDFSTETRTTPSTVLSVGRVKLSSVLNTSYGYFGGGQLPTFASVSTVDRLDFSNEVITNPGSNLPTVLEQSSGTSNNIFGYFGGGGAPTFTSTIERLDFSTETFLTLSSTLSTTLYSLSATSNSN